MRPLRLLFLLPGGFPAAEGRGVGRLPGAVLGEEGLLAVVLLTVVLLTAEGLGREARLVVAGLLIGGLPVVRVKSRLLLLRGALLRKSLRYVGGWAAYAP